MTNNPLIRLAITTGLTISLTSFTFRAEPALSINLVQNGGFESPELVDNSYELFESIDGWIQPNGSLEIQRNVAGVSFEKEQHAELDNNNFFQDIVTEVGKKYTLSFYSSPRPFTSFRNNTFNVLFGNVFSKSFELGSGLKETSWTKFSTEVLADSNLTRLQFNYTGESEAPGVALGVYLDDVHLETKSTSIPEPTSVIAVVILGLWKLSSTLRWKKKQIW
jgi:hypothetical protein